ncbi:MAG: class I SAM-dependent methyltransferase [bacterium]|nr:class I SAM-dependent methyltransferase [bacterium]
MDQKTKKKLLELVKRNYEEIAADFDASRKKELWPELLKLAGMVKDGDRVLDAGCGNGRLAGALADKKINYLGVDSSQKLIKFARENYVREIASSPITAPRNDKRFLVADILKLNKLPEKDFDYIFCAAVLHHLPGEDLRLKALEQMKNKLKPDGKIIITVWNLWSQRKFRKLIFKYGFLKLVGKNKMDFGDILFDWKNSNGGQASRRYYHAFANGELKKLAAQAGLKINKLYKDEYNYYVIASF